MRMTGAGEDNGGQGGEEGWDIAENRGQASLTALASLLE
jgi:hypothetical protein